MTRHSVGHTSRLLKNRIQEHNRCASSYIFDHVYGCAYGCVEYLSVLRAKYSEDPNLTERRNHLYRYFTALSTNLSNWHERTAYENLMITQLQPTLNKQLENKNSNLIYTCIFRINDPYEKIE